MAVLKGTSGNDALVGGVSNDTLSGEAGADSLTGGDGQDLVFSGSVPPNFSPWGEIASNLLADTGTEADTLSGGTGYDWLFAGYGDNVDGGADTDTLFISFQGATSGVTADFRGLKNGGTVVIGGGAITGIEATTWVEGSESGDFIAPIDTVFYPAPRVYARGGNDTIVASQFTWQADGGDGNDSIDASATATAFLYAWGGAGNDTITGGNGEMHGGDGDDVIATFGKAYGEAGNDSISGGILLSGGTGNDTLLGGTIADTLIGGEGDDSLDGGGGLNTVSYEDATGGVTIDLSLAGAQVTGGSGTDTLANFTHAIGSSKADQITGTSAANTLQGGDGNDTLSGGAGNDSLSGGDGYDLIDGGTGSDTIDGGSWGATVSFASATAGVTLHLEWGWAKSGADFDTITNVGSAIGGAFDDYLEGTTANNDLAGAGGNDTLVGRLGDDTLTGGDGDDSVDGGSGWDYASYSTATGGVNVDLASGTTGGAAGMDTLTGIERVIGSSFDDTIAGDGGNNWLRGQDGADVLSAGAGEDVLVGGAGNDTLAGGLGWDVAVFSGASTEYDIAFDSVSGSYTVTDKVAGRDGTDVTKDIENLLFTDQQVQPDLLSFLKGTTGPDTVTGTAASDFITGGLGNDSILGAAGDDVLFGSDGNDTIDGGDGFDMAVYGGDVTSGVHVDLSIAGAQDTGVNGIDTLVNIEGVAGTVLSDLLAAGDAGNRLEGGGGTKDTLVGGAGSDTLVGGSGSFLYSNGLKAIDTGDVGDSLVGSTSSTFYAGFNDSVDGGSVTGTGNVLYFSVAGASTGVNADLRPLAQSEWVTVGTGWVRGITAVAYLEGSAGNDTLAAAGTASYRTRIEGGGGDDKIAVTFYNSTVHGGDGNDSIDANYGAINTPIYGDAGNDTLRAGGYGGGPQMLYGGDGDDLVDGGNSSSTLDGGDGNDTIDTSYGWNVITGGAGDDRIYAGFVDTVDGGAGIDTVVFEGPQSQYNISYDGASKTFTVSDTVAFNWPEYITSVEYFKFSDVTTDTKSLAIASGTANADSLAGSDDADDFHGFAGNDTIRGFGGNDTLDGGAGNDLLDGGDGVDTATYSSATGGVKVNLSLATAQDTGAAGTDTLTAIENLTGTGFADSLTGSSGANRIEASGGDDTLDGAAGADTLVGGTGNDKYVVDDSGDVVTEADGEGTDEVDSSVTFDVAGLFVEKLVLTGTSAIDAKGDGNANTILGNSAANTIDGLAGADTIGGGAGADKLVGGDGNDVLYAGAVSGAYSIPVFDLAFTAPTFDTGADADTLTAGDGDDIVFAGYGDSVDGGAGVDQLFISFRGATSGVSADLRALSDSSATAQAGTTSITGVEYLGWMEGSASGDFLAGFSNAGSYWDMGTIFGLGGNDTIIGAETTGNIYGGDGDDYIDHSLISSHFTTGPDVHGDAGNDTLIGSGRGGLVDGGSGTDTAILAGNFADYSAYWNTDTQRLAVWTGTSGEHVYFLQSIERLQFDDGTYAASLLHPINGTDGPDTLVGTADSEWLDAGAGNDSISGLGGDDTLHGGTGDDKLNGGDGLDTAYYYDAASAVKVSLLLTSAQLTGGAGSDTLTSIERLLGSNFNDVLTGNAVANTIEGADGNDTIDGGAGADLLQGDSGNDVYFVDNVGDVIVERVAEGFDIVTSTVTFTLSAAIENLTLGGKAAISGTGNAQDNVITGNGLANVLAGNDGSDTLLGGAGNDTLLGGTGNDSLDGGAGTDSMNGGDGNDFYVVDTATDVVTEAADNGTDTVLLKITRGIYTLGANIENVMMSGTAGIGVTGNAQDNRITGTTGVNVINGGAGNDTIDGGLGADSLTGGLGQDVFRFSTAPSSRAVDKILDFNASQDTFALDHSIYAALAVGALDASAFQAGATSVAGSAAAHIIYNTATGAVLYDADGAGGLVAVQFATVVLSGASGSPTAANFVII